MEAIDRIRKAIYMIVGVIFAASILYMSYYIGQRKASVIPLDEVHEIKEWTYYDQMTGPRSVTTPVKVEKGGRDVFIFETKLPQNLPPDTVIAFLNRVDMTVEVNGRIVKDWKTTDAPIVGGPAKNSYFFIPIKQSDAGAYVKITLKGEDFSGKFFDAFVGSVYEVARFLEIKSGALQFGLSFALLVCSLAIIIAGLILRSFYKQSLNIILIAIGIFVASTWLVVDSFVFQFLFRSQFIDGLMSYMSTMCIIFPFIAYLDAIQEYRYKKWYLYINIFELAGLLLFTGLHLSGTANFSSLLLWVDLVVAFGVIGSFAITVTDIRRGLAVGYRFVSYGFLVFMFLSVVEIILINTVVERVEGGVIIAGLYILFAFAIVQQLYEIKEVQLERDRANEEGEAKTKFLASMSHEIRTPINSILGMNEMILKECRDPNIINYAGIINDSGTMLLSLINDVLDVSKIGSDMEEIVCGNYDPGKMFDTAAEMLRTLAEKKGLTIKVGKPHNLPKMLYGDGKRINQIVVNLLTNAVKYTEEGTVTFTGECFENSGKYILCFYVSDTGMGIREENLESIFDPFQRLDLKKNQSIQGTGLGLSIVKSLVEKMEGEIHVESTYGKGSTFSVRIPQLPMDENEVDRHNLGNAIEDDTLDDIDPNYIAPEARVLEVDDNTANQIVVKQFLKDTGVQLDIASDGKEALRLCKINKYDVILMDHMMPEPDGIETMHLIRETEGSLNIDTPQIILTANALMGSREKYEEEGFENYLSKPVESVRLLKMVRKYLPENKVMYKPKKRLATAAGDEAKTSSAAAREMAADDVGPVDIKALLARFDGNEETVKMILEEVIKEGERKIPLLRKLVEEDDVKRYAVEAHGVKGVMASTCIMGLSATAKSHELAAKGDNFGYVKDNIDSFIKEYEDVLSFIRDYLKGNE